MASNGWEKFYGNGENPNGMRALTPNGLSTDKSAGENHQATFGVPGINGPRWEMPEPTYPMQFGLPVGTPGKPGSGRSSNRNRSGE